MPVAVTGPDPALTRDLDAVMSVSPADTCLTVSVDGVELYDHRGEDLQVPASTEKLLTGGAALERLGADSQYETQVVTTAPIIDGVVRGDVVLVGDGDPGLVTSLYRAVQKLPAERPLTLLDDLAAELADQGITRIEGRIVGDESRYDTQRSVASWPDRYVRQDQTGPLSALAVDDGFLVTVEDERVVRKRSEAPALDAANALGYLLKAKGITVTGGTATGSRPPTATVLGAVTSPPMADVVADMLARSDNQSAELLAKELGVDAGGGGSTAAGALAIAAWTNELAPRPAGAAVVDGSGLDGGNQTTCAELVRVLDAAGGPTGPLATGLPVAGQTGTLAHRFTKTAAVGRLRAKTGSLASVTALAGFVALPEGATATFAYIANGTPVTAEVLKAQEFLAQILASYLPPCPQGSTAPVVDPVGVRTGQLGLLTAAPVAAALPGMLGIMEAVAANGTALLDRCSREAGAQVVLGTG